jgi:hypothetical protein
MSAGAIAVSWFDNGLYLLNSSTKSINYYADRRTGATIATPKTLTTTGTSTVGLTGSVNAVHAKILFDFLSRKAIDTKASDNAKILKDHFDEFEINANRTISGLYSTWIIYGRPDNLASLGELADCANGSKCANIRVRTAAKFFVKPDNTANPEFTNMESAFGGSTPDNTFNTVNLDLYERREFSKAVTVGPNLGKGFFFSDLQDCVNPLNAGYCMEADVRASAQYFIDNKATTFTPMENNGLADDIFTLTELKTYQTAQSVVQPTTTTNNRTIGLTVPTQGIGRTFTATAAATPTGLAVSKATGNVYVLDSTITANQLKILVYSPAGGLLRTISLNVADSQFVNAADYLAGQTGQVMRLTLDENRSQFYVHVNNNNRTYQFGVEELL